jgi:DNA-binding Lrp family transcriptional regulator
MPDLLEGKRQIRYKPILACITASHTPLHIQDIAQKFGLSYQTVKCRLHKLEKEKIVKRLKRGYYTVPGLDEVISAPNERKIYVNAGVRINPTTNGAIIHIYSKIIAKKCGGRYCFVKPLDDYSFEMIKSDKFSGSKFVSMYGTSVYVSISRSRLSEKLKEEISNKVGNVRLAFYPSQWGLKESELYGTESALEGALAESLSKFGNVEKSRKLGDIKADLLFERNGKHALIEITNSIPVKRCKKSDVRSALVMMRMYYFLKSGLNKSSDANFLIINDGWKAAEWFRKEIAFAEKYSTHVIFSSFKNNWERNVCRSILDKL